MAPDVESLEKMERRVGSGVGYQPVPVHQPAGAGAGWRVAPARPPPPRAWLECEGPRNPGEHRRLLDSDPPSPKLQAGLTLKVWDAAKKHTKRPGTPKLEKLKAKTKFQQRSEKLYAVLKPPYFILTIIVLIVAIHLWGSEWVRTRLEWSPGARWWREPWRLLGYGLVHASATHLATNAIVALAVGWVLEREQSRWRVGAVWAAGLAAGALGAGALQPRVRVVGASAAVYALLTAHLPNVCLRFGHVPLWWFRPLSVVVLAASESLSWLVLRAPAADAPAQGWAAAPVAWAAHALGAAVGVPAGFLVFSGENTSMPSVLVARVASAVTLLAGTALAIVHYTYWHEVDA